MKDLINFSLFYALLVFSVNLNAIEKSEIGMFKNETNKDIKIKILSSKGEALASKTLKAGKNLKFKNNFHSIAKVVINDEAFTKCHKIIKKGGMSKITFDLQKLQERKPYSIIIFSDHKGKAKPHLMCKTKKQK